MQQIHFYQIFQHINKNEIDGESQIFIMRIIAFDYIKIVLHLLFIDMYANKHRF